MNEKDIIRMAEEAGAYTPERYPDEWRFDADDIERFANLVAAAEREACAKLAYEITSYEGIADAIRARGQHD
jgi:hypothetical protein